MAKRQKTELVFNAQDREEFLSGFHKRKQARKKKAIVEAEKQYKEEITRLKKEKRDRIQKRLEEVSSVKLAHGIELTNFAEQDEPKKTTLLELPEHTVTITSAVEMDLSKSNDAMYLGANQNDNETVEVVELAETDQEDEVSKEKFPKESKEKEGKPTQMSKNAKRESVNRLAKLEKKTQMLKKKRRHKKVLESGKTPKSKKKWLKKKLKHRTNSSR